MKKLLQGIGSPTQFITHLGCIKACLDYLGVQVPLAWLYGGTGHAFINNIHRDLCPSGPTAWRTIMLSQLAPNLGYRTPCVFGWRDELGESFRDKQREAYDFTRTAIDSGIPCFGWQLEVPDFYVICGYDEVGYYFSGYGELGKGPLPWDCLGGWDVALIEVYRVELGPPAPDDRVVKEGIEAALRFAEGPEDWVFPGYTAGPAGFERWAEALQSGRASRDGHTYNAQCWGECRSLAVEFLAAAKECLPGRCDRAFDDARAAYTRSRDALAAMVALHPPRQAMDFSTPLQSDEAAGLAREVAAAERDGLACLARIATAL
ncbi:MAG: hypothetical protein HPY83_11705 [Anaerolineae bacterium]|nr:hypothetical protein [Anaerolineae bacterium]